MTHPGPPGDPGFPGPPLAGQAAGGSPSATRPAAGREETGSEREFARFYREHFPRLVAYLLYQGATAQLAADLAQDAMATAWRRWAEITSPRAYVYKVAGRAYTRRALEEPEFLAGEVPEPSAVLPRPGEAESWLQQQHVLRVLRALPPRQRQVLALTVDGWTPAEIAEMLGIEPDAVRASLMKARRSAAEGHRRDEQEAP
jgi:RNA polymerase sigma-70 factor (ECF subfamily)